MMVTIPPSLLRPPPDPPPSLSLKVPFEALSPVTFLTVSLVISSSPFPLRPPSPPSPPSQLRPPSPLSQLCPPSPPSQLRSLSPPLLLRLRSLPSQLHPLPGPQHCTPPHVPLEARSPPEPPDPPDAPFGLVHVLLLDSAFSQQFSETPTHLLNLALVFSDDVVSLVYDGDTSCVSKCLSPAVCSVFLRWLGCSISITISVSLPGPFTQVLSQSFPNLLLGNELISLVWYFGHSCEMSLSLALMHPFTAVCSPFTAVCSSTFVVFKSFYAQLWQLNGLMCHISIHHVNWILVNVYCPVSFVMEFVLLPFSLPTLCDFGAGNVLLKIRDTSIVEVLIKGFVAMLKIVDCALVAASFSGIISLIVVFKFQGFISLYSSMIVEIRGLLDVISCLSVMYASILLCCICSFVIAVCLAWKALFSCSMYTFSIYGE